MGQIKSTNLIARARVSGRKGPRGRVIFSPILSRSGGLGLLGALLILFMTACGVAATPEKSSQDISIEAQAVATATPVVGEEAGQDSTGAELSTEIIEPLSPLPTMASSETNDSAAGAAASAIEEMVNTMEIIPGSEKPVASAIADLMQRTDVAPEEITLVTVEAQEWSDASLGCPQEGYMYAQVITPGYKIVLEAQGKEYNYHTDSASTVVLCQE